MSGEWWGTAVGQSTFSPGREGECRERKKELGLAAYILNSKQGGCRIWDQRSKGVTQSTP